MIVGPLLCSLVCILLVPTLIAAFSSSLTSAFSPSWGVESFGDNAVTQAAKEIASYLRNCHGMTSQNALDNGCAAFPSRYAAFDPAFLDTAYAQWGEQHCPGCETWANGSFQCVSFVLAAYSQFHPLDFSGNGNMFDALYASQRARDLGYVHVATGGQNLPISPGDIMAWSGGVAGHVSIVLSWQVPKIDNGRVVEQGSLTFAQANGPSPIQTVPLDPQTFKPVVDPGYAVTAYIHPGWLPIPSSSASPSPIPVSSTNLYVGIARDAAKQAHIDETIFVNVIQVESSFNPKSVSDKGAIGIAQLMPATAQELGVNPWDPVASLYAAARLVAHDLASYGGDYAKALAAYNAGPGVVNSAMGQCGTNWRQCIPQETRVYLVKILGS